MNTVQNGIWSGILATGPMTLAMFSMQRSLPESEKSPLPPATLTFESTKLVAKKVSPSARADLTMLSHFAYGISCALIYSAAQKLAPKAPAIVKGGVFGLGVWAISYLGWTPLAGFRASAPNMPARRNAMMIAAHLVWGAALGYSEQVLRESGNQMLDGRRRARKGE